MLSPFGLPDAFRVAVLVVTAVAPEVVTEGWVASVVNEKMAPNVVPYAFRPSAQ